MEKTKKDQFNIWGVNSRKECPKVVKGAFNKSVTAYQVEGDNVYLLGSSERVFKKGDITNEIEIPDEANEVLLEVKTVGTNAHIASWVFK